MIEGPAKRPEDYLTAGRLHAESIPTGFLSSFGPAFLGRLYSAIALAPDSCVLFVWNEQGKVTGFVSGTLSITRCYQHVILHNLVSLGVPVLLKNLSLRRMRKVFETLFYAKTEPETGATIPDVSAELLSIAVSVDARGQGVGKHLIEALDEFFISRGLIGDYRVVTAAEDKRSNAFYRNAGFGFYRTFHHHDVPMNEYRKRPASVHQQASTRAK